MLSPSASAAVTYIGEAIIPGNGVDQSGLPATLLEDGVSPQNALNGIGSGLAYAGGNLHFALEDRGPNKVAYSGGTAVDNTTSYPSRFQRFTITLAPVGSPNGSGHYASYTVSANNVGTTLLKNPQGVQYVGISTAFSTSPAIATDAWMPRACVLLPTARQRQCNLPDKIEGYAWGPDLPDGRHLLLATNDNDFVQPGGAAGSGFPNYIWAFAVDAADVPDFQQQTFNGRPVPALPFWGVGVATLLLVASGFVLVRQHGLHTRLS